MQRRQREPGRFEEPTPTVKKPGLGRVHMPKATGKATVPDPRDEVICEKGRHVNCLHAKMAAKRAKVA